MKMTCREEAGANTDFVLQICSETLPDLVQLPSTASLQLDLDAISFQRCIKTVSLIVRCATCSTALCYLVDRTDCS